MTLDQVIRETDDAASRDFVNKNIDAAISKLGHVFSPDGKKSENYDALKANLATELANAYVNIAAPYYSSKGIMQKVVSPILRGIGFGFDALGTYAFWALGGYGLGFKAAGLVTKTAAEIADGYHYAAHGGGLEKGIAKPLLQSILDRGLAYLPLGIGEVRDLYVGIKQNKWDARMDERVIDYTVNRFNTIHGGAPLQSPRIEPLSTFRTQYQQGPSPAFAYAGQ